MSNYIYVSPYKEGRKNLACDEWFLDNLGAEDMLLYFYINSNAVIIGKNQNPWKECSLSAMREDNVELVRRITGGGAVYHDEGNLNFSFIAGKERYSVERQLTMILEAVRALGIPCEFSGRNDLLAGGRKFSGNAFCERKNMCQHHGTLLIDASLDKLPKYLNVSPAKIRSKGISSVRSRVVNLSELAAGLTPEIMIEKLRAAFQKSVGSYDDFIFDDAQLKGVEKYYEKQCSWQWAMGNTPAFDVAIEQHFGWGNAELLFTLEKSVITELKLYTDAIDTELQKEAEQLLLGVRFLPEELYKALNKSSKPELLELAAYLKTADIQKEE